MKLTGKCKEDFEKWIDKQPFSISHDVGERQMNIVPLGDMYEQLPPSMQYGVYVDFFDSVNYNIGIIPHWLNNNTVDRFDFEVKDCIYREYSVTRQEAREQAILKANEIYNGRYTN